MIGHWAGNVTLSQSAMFLVLATLAQHGATILRLRSRSRRWGKESFERRERETTKAELQSLGPSRIEGSGTRKGKYRAAVNRLPLRDSLPKLGSEERLPRTPGGPIRVQVGRERDLEGDCSCANTDEDFLEVVGLFAATKVHLPPRQTQRGRQPDLLRHSRFSPGKSATPKRPRRIVPSFRDLSEDEYIARLLSTSADNPRSRGTIRCGFITPGGMPANQYPFESLTAILRSLSAASRAFEDMLESSDANTTTRHAVGEPKPAPVFKSIPNMLPGAR